VVITGGGFFSFLFPRQSRLEVAVAIQVVAQISKSYFCLGPSDADRAYNKIARQLKLASKDMLDTDSDFRSLLIGRLLGFGERGVPIGPLVNMTRETGCRQILLRLLAPISTIGIDIGVVLGRS